MKVHSHTNICNRLPSSLRCIANHRSLLHDHIIINRYCPTPCTRSTHITRSLHDEDSIETLHETLIEKLTLENSIWGNNDQTEEIFRQKLNTLVALMPFLVNKLPRMKPKLVAALADNTSTLAQRMISLKDILPPRSNITAILTERPSLLLDNEYNSIPRLLDKLREHYSEDDIVDMICSEPLLLVVDIDKILEELQSVLPNHDHIESLKNYPNLVTQVVIIQQTSPWKDMNVMP